MSRLSLLCLALMASLATATAEQETQGLAAQSEIRWQALPAHRLEVVACFADNASLRETARELLTDEKALFRLAMAPSGMESARMEERTAAVQRIAGRELLERIYWESDSEPLRAAAVLALGDRSFADRLLASEVSEFQRVAALACLGRERELFEIASAQAMDHDLRRMAARQLTDPDLLRELTLSDSHYNIRTIAIAGLEDRALLASLLESTAFQISDAARERLCELDLEQAGEDIARLQALAENPASKQGKLAEQRLLKMQIAELEDARELLTLCKRSPQAAAAARRLWELGSPEGYAYLLNRGNVQEQIDAMLTITHPSYYENLAAKRGGPDKLHPDEILTMPDCAMLRELARNRRARLRRAAVLALGDIDHVLSRMDEERSPAVRAAMLRSLDDEEDLLLVVQRAYHGDMRQAARDCICDAALLGQADQALKSLENRLLLMESLGTSSSLVRTAIAPEFDRFGLRAVEKLDSPAALEMVATQARDRNILARALEKLEDRAALRRVAEAAGEKSVRIAAAHKAGTRSLGDALQNALAFDQDVANLAETLAAVSLFSEESLKALDDARIKDRVDDLCLALIRKGDESRIPEMSDMLHRYGNKRLAEDYLNCEQPDLYRTAVDWAKDRGFSVGSGDGSSRAKWGVGG